MPQYKNIGKSPWRRPTGELVPPGGIFETTVREQQRIQRRGYRGRLERVDADPPPPPARAADDADAPPGGSASPSTPVDVVETQAGWTLKMTPERYLKLHPSGGHAPLAREIVAAEKIEEDTSP